MGHFVGGTPSGTSCALTVRINGQVVAGLWNPPPSSRTVWEVARYLRAGENTIEWTLPGGPSVYGLRRFELSDWAGG